MGLERPLDASRDGQILQAFACIWRGPGPNLAKQRQQAECANTLFSVENSTEFDRAIKSRPAPPKGGGGTDAPERAAHSARPTQITSMLAKLASTIASKILLDC